MNEKQWIINCEHCGLVEDISGNPPFIRVERMEYHRRGSCSRNDLGV